MIMTKKCKLTEVFPVVQKFDFKSPGIAGLEEILTGKDVEYVIKGMMSETKEHNDDDRTITSFINTLRIDRDNEVVMPKGGIFDQYENNRVVLLAHDYSGSNTGGVTLGENLWLKHVQKGILAKTKYNDTEVAERVFTSRKNGFPMMESIGFIPVDWAARWRRNEDGGKYEKALANWIKKYESAYKEKVPDIEPNYFYLKWVMLEYSDVLIGSNPDAVTVQVGGKAVGETTSCSSSDDKTLVNVLDDVTTNRQEDSEMVLKDSTSAPKDSETLKAEIETLKKDIEELKQKFPEEDMSDEPESSESEPNENGITKEELIEVLKAYKLDQDKKLQNMVKIEWLKARGIAQI